MLFEGEGHRTTTVASGDEALELAARAVFLPDVIIADYNLPGRLTGAEIITRLREKLRRDIPAIILTGDISSDTLRKIADAGCVHLSKPAEPETLTQQIAGFLAEASRQRRRPGPIRRRRQRRALRRPSSWSTTTATHATTCRNCCESTGMRLRPTPAARRSWRPMRPDQNGCLVIDAMMPGMGGIALLESLNASNRGLPAIIITGYGDVAMAVRAMKAGAADFLEKPIRADELVGSIARALERSQDSRSVPPGAKQRANVSPA